MIEGVIFDLDDTIVNTKNLKHLRRNNWPECYRQMPYLTEPIISNDVLKTMRDQGLLIGIVTNSPRKYAEMVLNCHAIPYDSLVAYHDTSKKKPFPDSMIKCANNLKIKPQNCINIGDNISDIEAGKRANMFCVGVTWGESSKNELISKGCDTIFNTAEALEQYLLNIKGD